MADHVFIRASELDRALSCNGSLTLSRMVAPRESEEGWEGTAIHHAIAARLIKDFGATPPEGGLPPAEVPAGYKIPGNSLWIVDWCVRHIQETVPPDWSLLVEVPLAYSFDRWTLSGHIDWLAFSPCGTKSMGGDWKSVRNPVDPAESNEQCAGYLVLEKRAWPDLIEATFQICQPRVTEEDDVERISTVTVTNLDAVVASLDARVCAALDNSMCLKTGKQCKYCIGCSCPAIQAEQEFMELQLTPEMLAKMKREPDDAQLGEFVSIGRRLAKPLKDATEMLHERLDKTPFVVTASGTTITRKITRGDYTVLDPLKFMQAVRVLLPSDESVAKVVTFSMTRIKDEISEVLGCPKTGAAAVTSETTFDGHLRPLVEQGVKRTLVET